MMQQMDQQTRLESENTILDYISEHLLRNDRFIITSHVRSDGDSIGSELAIADVLRQLGKTFYIYNQDAPGSSLGFLPGIQEIHTLPPDDIMTYRHLIVLDSAFSERIGEDVYRNLLHIPRENVIAIDHHPNGVFNNLCYIDTGASCTGELVYNLLQFMGIGITECLATYLYTAIFTDTGGFRHTNTTSHSLEIVSRILGQLDRSHYEIIVNLYESRRLGGLKLLGDLIDRACYEEGTGIIFSYLTQEMFTSREADEDDIEDFVGHLRSVRNVRVACLFRESGDSEIKITLRSKDESVNLVPFVRKFHGGGHPMAAGFSMTKGDMDTIMGFVLQKLREYLLED